MQRWGFIYFTITIMELNEAREIYNVVKGSKHQVLVNVVLKNAVRYANIRVEWLMSEGEERKVIDGDRTLIHNAFISSCNALPRNMGTSGEDISWRRDIGSLREDIGDFACLINAVMGLNAR